MADASKSDHTSSNAGQSCRECRRRKGKCDGRMPIVLDAKVGARRPVHECRTKYLHRHLTEVEERLEKAEALLRAFFTDAQLSQMLAHGITNGGNFQPRLGGDSTNPSSHVASSDHPFEQTAASPTAGIVPGMQQRTQSFSPAGAGPDQPIDVGYLESPTASRSNLADDAQPLENPPAADDDFEWDERESSWNVADPGGGHATSGGGVDAEIPKITDGMATLTANDSNAGFLGSVSGSALLRLIWMGAGAEGTTSDASSERRRTLDQLFNQRSSEYPSASTWLRAQPMLTRAMVDTLVDAYFALYHPTFPILHEPSFREQYARLSGRISRSTWHTLANLVAALGSFVSSTCSDETHATLFNAVKANLSIESLETGSITLVQAFAMAANYLQKRNRPNSGYNYGGIALRLAISLGLHKEFRGWQTAPFKKEIRRRVWWSLCVLDVGATVTYGRPLNWPQVGVDIPFPSNIHEKDLPVNATSLPAEVNEATIYTYVRTQSSYHLHTIRIYNRLISNPIPSATELIALDDEFIDGWLKSLPPYFRDDNLPLPHEYLLGHAISRWRFRIMRIIMYRPFLIRWAQDRLDATVTSPMSPSQAQSAESIATKRCLKAAEECISAIFDFWSSATHTRLAAWYVLYFLLQAALIPIHCLRRNPTHSDAPRWRDSILTALSIINAMNNLNPSAPKCRDIIYRLCGESLSLKSRTQSQSQVKQETSSWNAFPTDTSYGNPFSFQNPDPTDAGGNSWMTEIDTAIEGYDIYVDRLSNAAMAGMGRMTSASEASMPDAFTHSDGTQIGTGVQDWDWGLML
ncbi:Zn(II)2Cys6 transcription factor [Cladophialophora carrionii]|uniref:Zn(II)2Cys6 transcription factor n=1 Tax=Cladophialophora carrionii TaxID=86049 RepID=A0A1C1CHW3_9EURO|nr:Zn(II)2Cys6 transcription factor [Cladophialophora carrionii]